ncbi:MAG: 3-deoxy-manno-octulosonate cytidylyltransferase [Nitrospirae bacterium]|nr:3-deoxy-manno-octulosonate cytidylyltransferase [Nitrospirota bacterium]MBF0535815.1 3-deoxy-manno-octulosonate cytidylyltransferase [Nitrospirota bacterium]MBF0617720.1 3-deoxy-manno-octulosonate cytidylyltransferase [Nitrospirota bacterium]
MTQAAVIIPARYGASRFPGKPLALICGKPMIEHVYERAKRAHSASAVFVATDNAKIYDTVVGFGGAAIMTKETHATGTDRIAEAARDLPFTVIVNVQGDEPLIEPDMIDSVIELMQDDRASMGTLKKKITTPCDIFDPNIVKVVTDSEGFALYFSRSTIPYLRDVFDGKSTLDSMDAIDSSGIQYYKHIGIYGYKKEVLLRLSELPESELEKAEKLEQLRALTNGYGIKVGETSFDTIAVDRPEDIGKVERWLNTYS